MATCVLQFAIELHLQHFGQRIFSILQGHVKRKCCTWGHNAYLNSLSAANKARLTTNSSKTPVPALEAFFWTDRDGKLLSRDAANKMVESHYVCISIAIDRFLPCAER